MLRFAKSAIRRLIFGSIFVSAAASAQMSITSSAFINGNPIPDPFQYNQGPPGQCTGGNNWSPPLAISAIPAGTNTLAIEVFDNTSPWLHWYAWGIPVSGTSVSLPYNYASSMPAGTQATNSFGTYGYGGPCAPPDGQTHLYVFVAYALTITGTTQPTSAQLNAAPNAILLGTRVYGQTVPWTPPTTPVISLASGANPSTFGQNVTFTATLSNGNSPTGTVTFDDGTTAICSAVALSGGTAQCSTSTLAVGSHSISAIYSGDSNNAGSTSNTVTQQVNAAGAQMSITSSAFTNGQPIPDPFQYNQGPPGQCPGGNNWSPPLTISSIPSGTNTLAIELYDVTNPWVHWYAWGIPVSGTSVFLPYNYASTMPNGTEAGNSFGTYGYGGPCAPPDGQTHQYMFTVYALTITGTTAPTSNQLNAAPQAILIGTRVYGETVPWSSDVIFINGFEP